MKEVSFDGNDLENMVLSLRLVMLVTVKLIYHLDAQNKMQRSHLLTDILKNIMHSLNILELKLLWYLEILILTFKS